MGCLVTVVVGVVHAVGWVVSSLLALWGAGYVMAIIMDNWDPPEAQ